MSSLAVLPLENLSKDPEEEYFADGMTDVLIADLAPVSYTHLDVYKRQGFPSAHGTLSNAAATVLEQILGNARFSVSLSNAAVPGVDLTYNNFTEITDDISDARVYGGIHFRTDQDAGASLGQKVGQYVYAHSLNSRNARAGCGDK